MAQDLSPGKSACILAVVVGCFAILWPSIFYPMLKGSIYPSRDDKTEYNRQEQSHYLRPNTLHPAAREQSRPIPQPPSLPPSRERRSIPPPLIAAKKPPTPGLRPPMTGGHVPTQKDNGPMGILMPIYTVGIVIFFVYTITKLVCKKHDNNQSRIHDAELRRLVYQNKVKEAKLTDVKSKASISADISKLGWQENDIIVSAISSLLQEVNHDILKREMKKEQREIHPAEDSTVDENSSENPKGNELESQLNEKCVEKPAVTDSHSNSQEVNDPIRDKEMSLNESCINSEELAKESSTLKVSPEEIACEINSEILITDSTKIEEESSVILENKVALSTIVNDSNCQEPNENKTEENKVDMDIEDKENISENNERGSTKQDLFEKENVPTTEL